ncbi:triggering receptor expressed on myeloid cells 2-like [Phyllobates terribilis]|uniref:triggering receptor expressed on myeloid cells 2-like n=1 Tax=Phyllobates terribilis TaxID=111132 RepID=UPI003CCAE7F7
MDKCFLSLFSIILLGILGWSLAKDITVYSGQLGENLNIVCPYQQRADRWKKKIWCKEDEVGFCQGLVSIQPYWSFSKKINVSADISDNHHKGIITINITNLQKSDAGVYQCRTVTFGDVNTLKRIKVQVYEELPEESVSESADVQYSISGSQSAIQTPVMLVAIGGSLISCKLLLMGLIFIWWKRHEDFYSTTVDQEPFSLTSSAEHSDAENSIYTAMEEDRDCPQYINYVYLGHINQAH